MSQILDDALLQRAAREAERALAEGDPDTLAGRFAPKPRIPTAERSPLPIPRATEEASERFR